MSTEEISQIDIFDGNDDNIEEKVSSSSPKAKTSKANSKPRTEKKILTLPLSRVRQIMKTDTDCTIIAYDAVFLVAKATEIFLQTLSEEALKYTDQSRRKTILQRDLDAAVLAIPQMCFLDGMDC